MSNIWQANQGHEGDGRRYVTDLTFELQMIAHFLESTMSGIMPGNQRTNLPLFPPELVYLWNQPYSEWALDPLHELSGTPNDRVMSLMGSMADPMRLVNAEMLLNHVKSKLWEGMALVSDAWWLTKKLDDHANIKEAMAYIQLVISVFNYLQIPQIHANMRDTYNLIYDQFSLFQDAINGLRREMDEEPLQITGLFEEFTRATFKYIEQQARDWVFQRLKSLRAAWKSRYMSTLLSGRVLNSTQGTIRIDNMALAVFQQLSDLGLTADQMVRVPIDGFKGLATPQTRPSNTGTQTYTSKELTTMYIEIQKQRKAEFDAAYKARYDERNAARRASQANSAMPEYLENSMLLFEKEFTHASINPAIDVYPNRTPETWVQNLINRPSQAQFGFVAYRISHAIDDQEWASFLSKLRAGMNAWSGVPGSDLIMHKATIQWLDGKDLNIPDDDTDAVRNHFRTFATSNAILPGMEQTICLAIDSSCIAAFNATSGPRTLRTGENADYRGYVIAVDSAYGISTRPQMSESLEFGYKGVMKIVDQLIWTDLYAFLQSQSQFMDELWRVAADHPGEVYVGPTVPMQVARWQRKKAEMGRA